ncbi:MAG: AraC family transcriptional regulator [Oscillospiraceae bacterium]|nr:AraC family transcriptional regulator [Oscillospiraceae bacterium]
MNNWTENIQKAIQYIEENLTEAIDVNDIASKAYVSPFYFQKIFNVLCGFTVGEYIRNRRLTLAGEELSKADAKVIDVALKYGYDSPDSFTRAFTKFHGISPSAAKEKGAAIKSFAPIRIKLTLEGGTIMEYRIVEKAAFTIMGKIKRFNAETSYTEIPLFWKEHYQNGGGEIIKGVFGACVDMDGKEFDYYIADLYIPAFDIPEGCETKTFEAGMWAVFPYRGECPKALQDVNTQIWSEWLPNCKEYELAGNYNLEVYLDPMYGEIWVPVKKKQ